MKTWSAIFNLFAIVIMGMLLIVYHNTAKIIKKDFDETKLNIATKYSAAAAFKSTLEVEDIGIDYTDISAVYINTGDSLDVFESLMCINYNMAISDENKAHIESFIPTAVLACNDGYYIAIMSEIDDTDNGVKDPQYRFRWSIKKPYVIDKGNTMYSVNLNNDEYISVKDNAGNISILNGDITSVGITREEINRTVNTKLTQDMIYQINQSNFNNTAWNYKFYLPPSQTTSGVNPITKPSILIMLQNVDFASNNTLDSVNIAGLKTVRKKAVVGFRDLNGNPYYCYEGQLDEALLANVENMFSRVEDAAESGYMPHYQFLARQIKLD